jgi:hypothetical protein
MWAVGTLLPNATLMGITGLFPQNLVIATTLAGIVVTSVAIVAGASLYTESAETARSMSARA